MIIKEIIKIFINMVAVGEIPRNSNPNIGYGGSQRKFLTDSLMWEQTDASNVKQTIFY